MKALRCVGGLADRQILEAEDDVTRIEYRVTGHPEGGTVYRLATRDDGEQVWIAVGPLSVRRL
jgi:hypothetical protein